MCHSYAKIEPKLCQNSAKTLPNCAKCPKWLLFGTVCHSFGTVLAQIGIFFISTVVWEIILQTRIFRIALKLTSYCFCFSYFHKIQILFVRISKDRVFYVLFSSSFRWLSTFSHSLFLHCSPTILHLLSLFLFLLNVSSLDLHRSDKLL